MAVNIGENLQRIRRQISQFEQKYAREPGSVQLIAVSKTQPVDRIAQACTLGQRDFGENYLQEALDKQAALADPAAAPGAPGIRWHFIGPIQSNKTRAIATHFQWVHSVDRAKVARRLSEQRPAELGPLNVLLQVNLSGESSKSGVGLDDLPALADEVAGLPGLSLQGLMAIPAPLDEFDRQRAVFRRLARARDELLARGHTECQHLSMGMSRDFEAAIAEGATLVRIGTDLFGPRTT